VLGAGCRFSRALELKDFEGKTLFSTAGTTPLKAVNQANRERLMGIRVVEAPDHIRGVEMVDRGEADGFVMDEVLLVGLIASRPDPSKLRAVGKCLTIEALGIMLSKSDAEFKQVVDAEIKRLILSREAQALHDRWFTQPIPPCGRSLAMPMRYLLKDFWKYPLRLGTKLKVTARPLSSCTRY
jgi:ABC-type amino acid transport substrate-binding protein